MNEKLPDIVDKKESIEKTPKVEYLFIHDNSSVLIRTVFPRENDIAVGFILVSSPISEEGMRNAENVIESGDISHKPEARKMLRILDTPLVFEGQEQAKEWFDGTKYTFNSLERKKVASFLGIEDTED